MSNSGPGSYVLVLYLHAATEIEVGQLGRFVFPAGYYLYVGSARGPGGVEARLARHRRQEKRCRWHVDYLRREAEWVEAWSVNSAERLECGWAAVAQTLPGANVPAPGFGASDCRCLAHLVHLPTRPSWHEFAAGR